MLQQLDHWMSGLGPWAIWFLGASAMIEYLFPPFPGDTIALLGGVYAARGQKSWALVFVALTAGSIIGAGLDYGMGFVLSRPLEEHARDKKFLGLSPERIRRLQERMVLHGAWLIIINRFLPGIRSLIFVAAGASRMSWKRVLWAGVISCALYNALLVGAGFFLGGNAERLQLWVTRSQAALVTVVSVIAMGLAARWWWARKTRSVDVAKGPGEA